MPITVTGPSTPVAGIFGFIGLSGLDPCQPGSQSQSPNPWINPPVLGLGMSMAMSPSVSSHGQHGASTPSRGAHAQALSPTGLMALHNRLDRHGSLDSDPRYISLHGTPASSRPGSPTSPDGARVGRATSLPVVSLKDDDLAGVGRAASLPVVPVKADLSASSSPVTSPGTSPLTSPKAPRPVLGPLSLPSPTRTLPPPLPTPHVLTLEEVRARRDDAVLNAWPAVTRVAGHTVIHRAVPGKPQELELSLVSSLEKIQIQFEANVFSPDELEMGSGETTPTVDVPLPKPYTPSPHSASAPCSPSSLSRRASRPASPAIFGPDLAGPLIARIARSRAAGTPEAWWAWGAPAIRAAAWGVLDGSSAEAEDAESEPEADTQAEPEEGVTWGDGGGFTTRLGSFVFAPPFEDGEMSELKQAVASIQAAHGEMGDDTNPLEDTPTEETSSFLGLSLSDTYPRKER